jgi:hypothetical protein
MHVVSLLGYLSSTIPERESAGLGDANILLRRWCCRLDQMRRMLHACRRWLVRYACPDRSYLHGCLSTRSPLACEPQAASVVCHWCREGYFSRTRGGSLIWRLVELIIRFLPSSLLEIHFFRLKVRDFGHETHIQVWVLIRRQASAAT